MKTTGRLVVVRVYMVALASTLPGLPPTVACLIVFTSAQALCPCRPFLGSKARVLPASKLGTFAMQSIEALHRD